MEQQKILEQIRRSNREEDLDRNNILTCLHSEDYLTRCDAIQVISPYIDTMDIQKMMIEKLNDKNYLVRCEAYEAFEKTNNKVVIYKLCERLKKESSSFARMYLVSTVTTLVDRLGCPQDIRKRLWNTFEKENQKRVIIAYLVLFYLLEKDIQYVIRALEFLNDSDYHIRCNVINLLDEILNDEIIGMVKSAYKRRYTIEDARAVRFLLEKNI